MAADASALRQALRRWSPAVVAETGRETIRLATQDSRTPRGTEPHAGPKIVDAFRAGAVQNTGSGARTTIQNIAPQARFLNDGTPAHGPVRAKALRFTIGGKVVFATRVRGIAARNWWRPVMETAFTRAVRIAARRTPIR